MLSNIIRIVQLNFVLTKMPNIIPMLITLKILHFCWVIPFEMIYVATDSEKISFKIMYYLP